MDIKSRIVDIIMIGAADVIAVLFLWYGYQNVHRPIPLPAIVKETLPTAHQVTNPLPIIAQAPLPNQNNISMFPQISLSSSLPLSNQTTIMLTPQAPFTPIYSRDRRTVRLQLQAPLLPNIAYSITISDSVMPGTTTWLFVTDGTVIGQQYFSAIQQVRQQMPYKDNFGHFSMYYVAQTDQFYVFIHRDLRADTDKAAVSAWLNSQGIPSIDILPLSYIPSSNL